MTVTDLYQQAIANRETTGERYGVARTTLANGDVIICSISPVAGRSIIEKHDRQSYGIIRVGQDYAKPISRARVAKMLRGQV